jgi:hypothetical protein
LTRDSGPTAGGLLHASDVTGVTDASRGGGSSADGAAGGGGGRVGATAAGGGGAYSGSEWRDDEDFDEGGVVRNMVRASV